MLSSQVIIVNNRNLSRWACVVHFESDDDTKALKLDNQL